jgi:hypothetical protein
MQKRTKIPLTVSTVNRESIPNQASSLKTEERHYFLSFKFYNEKMCEVDLLEKNRPKECIKILKRISQTTIGNLKEKNIDKIPIENRGEYKKLYSSLPNEVEVFEHKIQGDARLFYFTAASDFFVLAITNSHLETNKTRR